MYIIFAPGIYTLKGSIKKDGRTGIDPYTETAVLFMMNKIRGTSQLNIDILMYGSHLHGYTIIFVNIIRVHSKA